MRVWRFLDYVDEDGKNVIELWLRARPTVRAGLDIALAYLGTIADIDKWDDGHRFKWLTKEKALRGLGEIRIHVDGLAQRPVGCRGRAAKSFVLLAGCDKHRGTLIPADAFVRAAERMTKHLAGKGTTVERHVP